MSAHDALLAELMGLETELHRESTRRDRRRVEMLLHPEFAEFGRSGTRYSRDAILAELEAAGQEGAGHPVIHAQEFELAMLAEGVALLTYVSAHVDGDGNLFRHSLRSSIWVQVWSRGEAAWQIRFHQGTPKSE